MKLIDLHEDSYSADTRLKYKELNLDEAISYIVKHCSAQIQHLKEKDFFVRQDFHTPKDFSIVDTLDGSKRRSTNGKLNLYTEILDSHPEMKDFPKRSHSIISYGRSSYGATRAELNNSYYNIIVPEDNAKVGLVGVSDIWDISLNLFGSKIFFSEINITLDKMLKAVKLNGENGIEDLKKMDALLAANDEDATSAFLYWFPSGEKNQAHNFLESLYEAFSPTKTGLTWCHANDFKSEESKKLKEIWIQGKMVIIKYQKSSEFMKMIDDL